MKNRFAAVTFNLVPVILFVLAPAVVAWGQETPATPQVLTNPEVNSPQHFDVSPPLSEMATEVVPHGAQQALPTRRPKLELLKGAAQTGQGNIVDGALQTSAGPLVNTNLGLNLLGVGNGFPAYFVPDAPPDVNLAVGDTQVLQWVNVSYAVFDKTTGAIIAGPIAGNAFWAGFGGPCQTSNSGDPIAQWDKIAHRWVVSQNTFSGSFNTCIAVSTTPDAMGTYYRFAFTQPGFPDYPKLGIMPDAYYQSQNNFGQSGSAFVGARPCAYDRAKMLVGDSTAKQICFQTGTFDDGLLPADLDSAGTPPPSGQPEVFLGSIDNGSPNVYKYLFHVDFTTPSNSTFTGAGGTMPVPGVASFSLACGGFGACIPQPSPGEALDSLGDRLMYRLAYRNFSGDHQTWLVSHSVTAGSSVGERWYEFRAPENSTSLSVAQQGTFAPDSKYRWMGSIAMDSAQDIALGYSVSSSSTFPSINYTGRVPGDPLGTMEAETQIVAGTGSQVSTSNRWGDYSSMAIDAADDCTFWYTAEYYMTTASFGWSTRLASFKFPGCGGAATPDFSISASPSSQSVVQGSNTSYTVTIGALNGYTGTVNLSASGLPSGASASFIPASVTTSGNSTMTVTTLSSTPTGSYPITITGKDSVTSTLTHSTQVTLVVTGAQNFSISATPTSRTVLQGGGTTYTATVTALNGFSGNVGFTVSGLPSGAGATFNPTSVTGSGSSTMSVTTSASTPTGSYTLTITGTSGSLTHTATVTLVVSADFTISVSPASQTVKRGSSTSYTVTIGGTGFAGTVSFSVSGLPQRTSGSFTPSTLTGTGTSTLTVKTNRPASPGTSTLTITGTSGSLIHSTTATLVIQ